VFLIFFSQAPAGSFAKTVHRTVFTLGPSKKKQETLALDCSTTRYFLNSEIQQTPPKAFGVKQRWIFSEFSKSALRTGWLRR
jgi:hypothetical protein